MNEEKMKHINLKTLYLIKLALLDKLQEHPLSTEIDKLMENDENYILAVKEAYLDEIVAQIIEDHEELNEKTDINNIVEEYAIKLDDIYKELTNLNGEEIVLSLEDLQKVDKDFPYQSYLTIRLVLRYINVYGLYNIINQIGESDTDLNMMFFITAFLNAIAEQTNQEDEDKVIKIKDVVYHRTVLKNLPNAIKEELK